MPEPLDALGKAMVAPVLPDSSHAKKGLLLDIHITDEMRNDFRTAKKPGKAAELGTKKKFKHYEGKFSSSRYTLFPFVTEFDGLLGPHAHVFMAAAADHQHEISEGAWLRSECIRNWRQSVSLALQEVISITVLRTMARTVPSAAVDNRPRLDLLAYTRVRLPCPANPVHHVALDDVDNLDT